MIGIEQYLRNHIDVKVRQMKNDNYPYSQTHCIKSFNIHKKHQADGRNIVSLLKDRKMIAQKVKNIRLFSKDTEENLQRLYFLYFSKKMDRVFKSKNLKDFHLNRGDNQKFYFNCYPTKRFNLMFSN